MWANLKNQDWGKNKMDHQERSISWGVVENIFEKYGGAPKIYIGLSFNFRTFPEENYEISEDL